MDIAPIKTAMDRYENRVKIGMIQIPDAKKLHNHNVIIEIPAQRGFVESVRR
jgi:hypothetical protein